MHIILNTHDRRLLDELYRNSGRPDVASCNSRSEGEWPLLMNNEKIFSQYHHSREVSQLFYIHEKQLNPVILLK